MIDRTNLLEAVATIPERVLAEADNVMVYAEGGVISVSFDPAIVIPLGDKLPKAIGREGWDW